MSFERVDLGPDCLPVAEALPADVLTGRARWAVETGDCLKGMKRLPEACVQCVVTSPPYWGLRDYGVEGQIGLEETPEQYVAKLVKVFRGVRRILRDDGTVWLNLGDSYYSSPSGQNGTTGTLDGGLPCGGRGTTTGRIVRPWHSILKPKDLVGIPWRVAFALQSDGWYLRSDIIWHKPDPMPESVTDRPSRAHEYLFLLVKRPTYYYDADAIREANCSADDPRNRPDYEPKRERNRGGRDDGYTSSSGAMTWNPSGRNRRTVWTITKQPFSGSHFAVMPEALVSPCILAGASDRGCCPACGAPYRRVVDRERVPTRPGNGSKVYADPDGSPYGEHNGSVIGNRDPLRHVTSSRTLGWEAGCACNAGEPVPCVVFDPFTGSGTVGVVCRRTGRRFIGYELNPDYTALAHQRIANPDWGGTVAPDEPGLFDLLTPAEQ